MKALFIGGTGYISTAVTALAVERGIELTLINRGQTKAPVPKGVRVINVDVTDTAAVNRALGTEKFDSVTDWIAFTTEHIERDIALFRDRTRQFIFISSASIYQKPQTHYLITESTPLANPYWDYSRNKIACEELLLKAYREQGFPITIVRPSLTYGINMVPLAINSWLKQYTIVDRMRKGKPVIVPGDGSSLWVITHNTDFAKGFLGLVGHRQAIGQAFHITTDEVMNWDQFYRITAEAAGVEPNLVHIATDFLVAQVPEWEGGLTGDKSVSVVFDNSKIKRFVPDYRATTTWAEGIRRSIAWFDADPARKLIDEAENAKWDKVLAAYAA
jgi:nucleoside-diphosphate-sugar epimerase